MYNKTNWKKGDIITAARLNKIEEGIRVPNAAIHFEESENCYYLTDGYRNLKIEDIISFVTCFRGDTTYVTMADGSKKLIQDVQVGDEVLGYDVNRKEYCTTIVIENTRTGAEMGYWTFVMDDGTTIDIWNNDSFITCHKSERFGDADGDYIGFHDIQQLLKWHDQNEGFRKIIKDTGNLENATSVIYKRYIPCAELTPRFSLYTANGTMFVNGLLHAQSPRNTIAYFKRTHIRVPGNIMQLWDEISASYTAADEGLPDDHIQRPEKVGDIEILAQAKVLIQANKNYLASTDYKAMKFAEGAITEEEWLPVKAQRAAAREVINAQEAIVEEYKVKVATDNPEFINIDPYGWKAENTKWKAVQGILDAHAEDFREWFAELL